MSRRRRTPPAPMLPDGADRPTLPPSLPPPAGREERKLHQLCAAVREVLSLVIAGDADDPVLDRAYVASVAPAPDAGRLMVTVALHDPATADELEQVHDALAGLRGHLRHEIAAEINRKKTPELVFQVVPWSLLGPPAE